MKIDYKEVFDAFTHYLDEAFNEKVFYERCGRSYDYFFSRDQYYRLKVVNGYYLGSVSEESFLEVCDNLENDLYDDYSDMYEPGNLIVGIPLQHYIQKLQEITGKHPTTVHHWLYLGVTAAKEGQ